jgi:hypothetical protein
MPQRAKVVLVIGDFVGGAVRELMLLAFQEAALEEARNVGGLHRAVGDAAGRRFNLDQRFEPKHAARAVADDLDLGVALLGFGGNGLGDGIGAHRQSGSIARDIDPGHARVSRSRSERMLSKRSLSTQP